MDREVFGEFAGMAAADPSELGMTLLLQLIAIFIGLLVTTVVYVLQSVGLYSIAKRRGIHNPWLAWIPVGNMWIVGSISDQYQYVVKGRIKNRRKTLLGLCIATTVIMVVTYVVMFVLGIFVIGAGMSSDFTDPEFVGPALALVAWVFVLFVVSIVFAIFQFIALYDLFVSCNPSSGAVMLILCILINNLMPFLIFGMRNRDDGMPPRRVNPLPMEFGPEGTYIRPQD